jgi:quercetin dioxygenase-like cupin family protein
MHVIDFTPEFATLIAEYASRGASAQLLADGAGEAHVYAVHLAAGGEVGPHPAGFGQLFLVVAGEGWVSGGDGVRHAVRVGQGAVFAPGAVMIQLAELTPAPGRST